MSKLAEMTVLNVQMGLAIRVKAPNGKWIVIDMGTSLDGANKSPSQFFRDKEVSYMVITHPHMDHISDVLNFDCIKPSILRHCVGLKDDEILSQAGDNDFAHEKYQKYVNIVNSYSCPISKDNLNNPAVASNYGGLEIQTFSTSVCDHSNINNFSVITVLKLGNIKVVICGDNEIESLDRLMKQDDFKNAVKDAGVLVAPHHGRESAYNNDFVELVHPYITIISDGSCRSYSASDKYSNLSQGYSVYDRAGLSQKRYCVTTRKDGDIKVTFGTSDNPQYIGTLRVELI